jgi:hypothetical protein
MCICIPPPPHQFLNAWINLYETWYVYHDTWTHLDDVLHKSLPSLCVPVCYPLSLLSNGSLNMFPRQRIHAKKKNCCTRLIFYAVRVVSKESTRLVLPRTSCYIFCIPLHITVLYCVMLIIIRFISFIQRSLFVKVLRFGSPRIYLFINYWR